ncbi:DUF4817 domain-containing protein [Streptococcus pneumoniae]
MQIIKLFYENGSSVRATFRALRPFYGRDGRPVESTIRRLVGKFESTGSVNNQPTLTRRRNAKAGAAITVNGERYRSMITNFFWPKLDDMDTDDMWFQQDGATCHTAHATMDILHERFPDMVISRGGDINWPPRSCDLTPLDFFLWGYLKSLVYANKPLNTDDLKVNIRNAIAQIEADMCSRVIENWTSRIRATKRSRGGHLNDVIFHT